MSRKDKDISEKLDKKIIEDIAALTPMQEGMLFHYLRDPQGENYLEQLSLEISGEIDVEVFEKAWNVVIRNNEMLRTLFRWETVKNPSQLILKEHHLKPRYIDLSVVKEIEKQEELEKVKAGDREEGFDLRHVPLRITLCKIGSARHVMLISNHHILYDGWSNGIILKEFFEVYEHLVKGEILITPVKTKYKTFIKYLQQLQADKTGQENFWKDYLKGFDSRTAFRMKNRTAESKTAAANYSISISLLDDAVRRLESYSRFHKITLASVLYSAWGILLQKYSYCRDVVFGTTVSGRNAAINGIGDIVGLFINTLPFRVESRSGERVQDFLARINDNLQKRAEYEHISLVEIKKYTQIDKSKDLFDTLVVVENYPLDTRLRSEKPGSTLSLDGYSMIEGTHYDLTINISLHEDNKINIYFFYNPRLFDEGTVITLSHRFVFIVNWFVDNPGGNTDEIDILLEEERQRILYRFNDTDSDYPGDKTIHRLFEEQVERTPEKIALVGSESEIREVVQLTYRELNLMSEQLARLLKEKGVCCGGIVGVMIERSIEMMVGIFAVLKAGGAYLPIDPGYPRERIDYMLKDSNARVLLKKSEIRISKYETNPNDRNSNDRNEVIPCVVLDFEHLNFEFLNGCPSLGLSDFEFRASNLSPANLSYVIYTSGSTGRPKGVVVEHHPVVNRLKWMQARYPLDYTDMILQKTPITFDVSVWELFWWAFTGASLCLLQPGGEKDPAAMAAAIETNGITTMHFVPSMLEILLEYIEKEAVQSRLSSLKWVFASGEALRMHQVERFNKYLFHHNHTRLINLYGPTEATVDVSYFDCYGENLSNRDTIPIGKPIHNIRLIILDYTCRLTPVGVPGELCIGGVGLARGYLNRPELTAEKFNHDLWDFQDYQDKRKNKTGKKENYQKFLRGGAGSPGLGRRRLYKTGDLARWQPDGNIEFLGRIDFQVKIRGFRIELEEIETHLLAYEAVKQAVVTVLAGEDHENHLAAYIVSPAAIETSRLRTYLKNKLPDYMIPAHFIRVEQVPLTPNGKVDRKRLPKPGGSRPRLEAAYAAPKKGAEKIIAKTWKELLNLDKVGIDDNFFDLGGNSFSIIRLSSRLKEAFHREVPVVMLFNYPTIRSSARFLSCEQVEEAGQRTGTERGKGMDIAIIGMAGRFPGARNIEQYWENLKNGVESVGFFSDEELEEAGIDPQLLKNPNYVKAKGYLEGVEYFDAFFFDYSVSEANVMDPQLRLFHECAWEALEDAGYNSDVYGGSIGLWAGITNNFHWLSGRGGAGLSASEQFELVNLNSDYFSTLISYKFNLKGPSVTVQTACSTSLAAIDTACQALVTSRCDMALVGGVGITYPVKSGYLYQEGMIFSADGHCRVFDVKASGTMGGNGAGVVVLKPLSSALSDGDNIYAVIKGSAANNDGRRKVGYNAPSVEGQAEVIRAAQQRAGIAVETIGYIETHGTGTALGDPVEVEGLKRAVKDIPLQEASIPIGSLKANVGHLDAAAGVAGVIKSVMALKHRLIPPGLHYEKSNPQIDFENSPFYVNTELREWKRGDYPLRAGVSSFGIGGTNVHVILEEAPQGRGGSPCPPLESKEYRLILLSAKTGNALGKMTENLVGYFKKNPDINLTDAAYTLQVGRKSFAHRRMVVAPDTGSVIEALSPVDSRKVRSFYTEYSQRPVVFMFPGQGAQYVNMGLGLYEKEPVFQQEMDRCFNILNALMDCDIRGVIYPGDTDPGKDSGEISPPGPDINRAEITLPVVFIFEYALAKLLMAWGIRPQATIGYSFGEYISACLSGVFSLTDALKLIVLRGELMKKTGPGAMLSVPLSGQELEPLLKGRRLSLGIDNGPSCVVSGAVEEIKAFAGEMKQKRCMCMPVNVSHAVHSLLMNPIKEEFEAAVRHVRLYPPSIPYISNVTGTWITAEEAGGPAYWAAHMAGTARFADGVRELLTDNEAVFLEVGPGRDLSLLLRHHTNTRSSSGPQTSQAIVNIIRNPEQKESDISYILKRLGTLWGLGVSIDWQAFHAGRKRYRLPMPTYPFERQRYWDDRIIPGIWKPVEVKEPIGIGKRSNISNWFYIPSWERALLPVPHTSPGGNIPGPLSLLVFLDETGLGVRLISQLQEEGHHVVAVGIGSSFEQTGENAYVLNPQNGDDYGALMVELCSRQHGPQKIVHLWNVNRASPEMGELDYETVEKASHLGFYSLFYLARALNRQSMVDDDLMLLVVSNHIHDLSGSEDICPGKAILRGPCLVIPQEFPRIACRSMDIRLADEGGPGMDHLVRQVMAELHAGSSHLFAAYRGNRRWVQTFAPAPLAAGTFPAESAVLREKGVYLITGGLGYIGLHLAAYLAASVKARLILIGRSFLPPREEWRQRLSAADHNGEERLARKIRKVRELERLGAEVLVCRADVSDPEQMQQVIVKAERHFGPVNGVIHAAGITGDRSFRAIMETDKSECEAQFQPKIKGLLVLEKILRPKQKELDFCVLFSSLSTVLGGLGFTAYSAANLFMNAFAAQHRKKNKDSGVNWISIDWDSWQLGEEHGDSVVSTAATAAAADLAQLMMTPGEGAEVFQRILSNTAAAACAETQITISTGDLQARIDRWIKPKAGDKDKNKKGAASRERPQLSNLYKAPGNKLQKTLVDIWQPFFGLDSIGIRDDFFELGGDSLKAITMVSKIREKIDVELSLTTFFSHPTIELLSAYIDNRLTGAVDADDHYESSPVTYDRKVEYPVKLADLENLYEPFPLTNIQTAYFMGRSGHFEIGSISTHFYLEVNTRLDIRLLNKSFNRVIARHPMLRTIITEDGTQQILEEIPVYDIRVKDLSHLEAGDREMIIVKERERMSHHIFDLGRWPLFEIKAFQFSPGDLYLVIGFDMIIGDASSLELIAGELMEFYRNPDLELVPLEFTFRDYVLAAREFRNSDVYAADREYWLNRLEDFPAAPQLPLARQPSEVEKPYFRRHREIFSREEWAILQEMAKTGNITASVLLCTAYAQVLAYWSNQREFAVNLTVFNRYPFHKEVDKIVGDFTSLILLAVDWGPEASFMEMSGRLQRSLMGALEHRHYDGVEFIREISRYKNLGTQAVMPVVFTSTVFAGSEENFRFWDELADIRMSVSQTSQVFVDNQVRLQDNRLVVAWDYVAELFEPDVIDTMFHQYIGILRGLIAGDREYRFQLPEADREMLESYNRTGENIPASLLHRLFQKQAAVSPGNIALEYGGDTLSYKEVDEKSNQVARYLRERGVGRNDLVALLTPRCIETIVSVMGILKTGGAYVPIEPEYPRERQKYIMENSGCKLLLSPELYLHSQEKPGRYPAAELENVNRPEDLAYVIYTSGSTGRPKGVVITHQEAANTIIDINGKFSVNETDRIMGISSMCFDLSVYDVFGSLSTGACLVLIPTQKDVDVLTRTLKQRKITTWNSVPAILDMVVKNLEEDYLNHHLRLALLSGDWIPLPLPGAIKGHFPLCDVISLGGATEGSIWSIYYPVTEVKPYWKSIPYGYPLANQAFYVLNFRMEPCPVGVAGELYIGGAGVAEGYIDDREKTRDAFIQHPALGRIYRTGDYGVFHKEGYIEFQGRKDRQVKLRGYRVELGEIEACLREHGSVKSAVVIDWTGSTGARYLCAYLVPNTGRGLTGVDWRVFLSGRLPGYMIPTFFLPIDHVPLTPNGKVNRKALPEPDEEITGEIVYEAPQNENQVKLVELVQGVLAGQEIGINDDFFTIGGDSLKANLLVSRIRKQFNVKMSLAEIFNRPTVKEMAKYIEDAAAESCAAIEAAEEKEYYPLSSHQYRLYIVQQIDTAGTSYNLPEIFVLVGQVDEEKLENTFRRLIQRYDSLKTSFELVDDKPVQRVHRQVEFAIEYYGAKRGEDPGERIIRDFIRNFDLSQAPLFRVGLLNLKQTGEQHLLMVDMHHIIMDAISIRIFIKEFKDIYAGEDLPPLKLQYKDFTRWQKRLIVSGELEKQETYWLKQFSGELPELNLHTDYERETVQSFEGNVITFMLGKEETEGLKALAGEYGATLYMVVLSLLYVMLFKLTEQEDIVVGTAASGRGHADLDYIIGMFVNTLPLRNYPSGEKTFKEFLQEVKAQALEAFENQDYQFDDLVENLLPDRSIDRNPLFDVMFAFDNLQLLGAKVEEMEIPGLRLKPYEFHKNISHFDLNWNSGEEDGHLLVMVEYNTRLFKTETIESFIRYYTSIASSVLDTPDKKLADIKLISREEKEELVYQFIDELENE
jgi:amino acid adenylation domain-containing protein